LVHDERHDARATVLRGIGDEREPADHLAVDDVAARSARGALPLRGEDAEVVARPRARRPLALRVVSGRRDRRAEGALVAGSRRGPVQAVARARAAHELLRIHRLSAALRMPAGVLLLRAHVGTADADRLELVCTDAPPDDLHRALLAVEPPALSVPVV